MKEGWTMFRKSQQPAPPTAAQDRTLEVTASMQGTLAFKDPVNLRISGRFEGSLDTLGSLVIGDRAQVEAQITGDSIVIAGRAQGKIVARRQLRLVAPARVTGELWTPRLIVEEGARFDGTCHMAEHAGADQAPWLTMEEVAQYLEIEPAVVRQWASQGRLPAVRDGEGWRVDKHRLDEWIASERAK